MRINNCDEVPAFLQHGVNGNTYSFPWRRLVLGAGWSELSKATGCQVASVTHSLRAEVLYDCGLRFRAQLSAGRNSWKVS